MRLGSVISRMSDSGRTLECIQCGAFSRGLAGAFALEGFIAFWRWSIFPDESTGIGGIAVVNGESYRRRGILPGDGCGRDIIRPTQPRAYSFRFPFFPRCIAGSNAAVPRMAVAGASLGEGSDTTRSFPRSIRDDCIRYTQKGEM